VLSKTINPKSLIHFPEINIDTAHCSIPNRGFPVADQVHADQIDWQLSGVALEDELRRHY
jgi:hypothetical protein